MSDFSLLITEWYRQNKRDLPWRDTNDPYFIWLSEIILQQTRVEQGFPYYEKFINNFPTVELLANSDEQKVLKLWQGLGYYSRARNLHTAAKQIVENHGGKFPTTYKEIKALKGIGDYTAAAVASFAYNLPHPVVDGNVFRVLSRFYDDETPIDTSKGKKLFTRYAEDLISKKEPGLFNQAIMELGALVCKPKNPDCEVCPISAACLSRQNNTFHLRPVKSKKTKVKEVYFYYLYTDQNKIPVEKRTKGIWQNMYQLPLIESDKKLSVKKLKEKVIEQYKTELIAVAPSDRYTHLLSHRKINAEFWKMEEINKKQVKFIAEEELQDYPFPRLITRFFEDKQKREK